MIHVYHIINILMDIVLNNVQYVQLQMGFSRDLCMSSFQRKVEMFHNTQAEFGDRGEGYVSRTIALVNCCPPLRCTHDSPAPLQW